MLLFVHEVLGTDVDDVAALYTNTAVSLQQKRFRGGLGRTASLAASMAALWLIMTLKMSFARRLVFLLSMVPGATFSINLLHTACHAWLS